MGQNVCCNTDIGEQQTNLNTFADPNASSNTATESIRKPSSVAQEEIIMYSKPKPVESFPEKLSVPAQDDLTTYDMADDYVIPTEVLIESEKGSELVITNYKNVR